MSKRQKLLKRLLERPSDFTYDEARGLLGHLGYTEESRGRTAGSRVAFVHSPSKHIIRLHKPHPGNTLRRYQIDALIEALRDREVI